MIGGSLQPLDFAIGLSNFEGGAQQGLRCDGTKTDDQLGTHNL
jgi:hypothetical protein